MPYKELDRVATTDGTVGYLIVDFHDGWFLFEYEDKNGPHAYDDKEIRLEDIAGYAVDDMREDLR